LTDVSGHWRARGAAFFHDHSALVIAVATFSLVVLRILAVARFDVQVALALLQAADPAKLLLALAVSLAPTCGTALSVLAGAAIVLGIVQGRARRYFLSFAAGAILLAVYAAPVGGFIFGGIMGVAIALATWVFTRRQRASGASLGSTGMTFIDWLVFGGFAISIVLQAIPWVPSERLTFGDGTATAGYVVSEEAGWTRILSVERAIVVVPSTKITARELCSDAIWSERTLIQLLDRQPDEPSCRNS